MKKNGYGQYLLTILEERRELEMRKRYEEAKKSSIKQQEAEVA